MQRDLRVAEELRVVEVRGLVLPTQRPQRHVFDWTRDGLKRPGYFRWSWHVTTGDLYVGTVQRHDHQLPKNDPARPFESFLRGFLFYRERTVAIRPYFWPLTPYEEFDRNLNDNVMNAITRLLRPLLRTYHFETAVDNEWLTRNFGHLATSW